LCDGKVVNGLTTPDLRDKFVIGASGDNGTNASTTITGSLTIQGGSKDAVVVSHTHTVNDPGHSHNYTTRTGTAPQSGSSTQCWVGAQSVATTNSTTGITMGFSGESGTNKNLPPYYALAFIMRIR
jgi:hypothetical protein